MAEFSEFVNFRLVQCTKYRPVGRVKNPSFWDPQTRLDLFMAVLWNQNEDKKYIWQMRMHYIYQPVALAYC